jgi:aspartate/methionine/tyrosine aminotransferase
MTGFRVGWTLCSNLSLVAQMTKLQEPLVSCGVPFAQAAATTALLVHNANPQLSCTVDMRSAYKENRDAALRILASRGYRSEYSPGGAFYLPILSGISGMNGVGVFHYRYINLLLHKT